MNNRNMILFCSFGLLIMSIVGIKIFLSGQGGLLYVLFPSILCALSFYGYFTRR